MNHADVGGVCYAFHCNEQDSTTRSSILSLLVHFQVIYNEQVFKLYHVVDQCLYGSDYQKKIDACKQKKEEARSESAADAELDLLQRELEEELEKERMLKEEFR